MSFVFMISRVIIVKIRRVVSLRAATVRVKSPECARFFLLMKCLFIVHGVSK